MADPYATPARNRLVDADQFPDATPTQDRVRHWTARMEQLHPSENDWPPSVQVS